MFSNRLCLPQIDLQTVTNPLVLTGLQLILQAVLEFTDLILYGEALSGQPHLLPDEPKAAELSINVEVREKFLLGGCISKLDLACKQITEELMGLIVVRPKETSNEDVCRVSGLLTEGPYYFSALVMLPICP